MKAILLAGGHGTRLHPLTETLPKPMIPVLARPWLERLVAGLARSGTDEIICSVHHRHEVIMESIGDGLHLGARVRYAVEPRPLGTGGAIRYAGQGLDETFLVFNADVAHHFDLAELIRFHRDRRALVTIGLVALPDLTGYGAVQTRPDGAILRFVEKPEPGAVDAAYVNAGVYVFEPAALQYIPAGRPVSVERETFPALVAAGARLFGMPLNGYWRDLGTPERYLEAHRDILAGRWRLPETVSLPAGGWRFVHPDAHVDPAATLLPPVWIGPRTAVGAGARVGPWVVAGSDVRVGRAVRLEDTVIWDGSDVEAGASLSRCIVGHGARVPAGTAGSGLLIAPTAFPGR